MKIWYSCHLNYHIKRNCSHQKGAAKKDSLNPWLLKWERNWRLSRKIRNDKSDWLSMHANLRLKRMKRVLTWSGVAMGGEQEHSGQHHQGDGHQWGESHKLSHSVASFYLCLSRACTRGPVHLGHDSGGDGIAQGESNPRKNCQDFRWEADINLDGDKLKWAGTLTLNLP